MRSLIVSMAKERVSNKYPEINVRILYSKGDREKENTPHCHVYRKDVKLCSVSLVTFEVIVGELSLSSAEKKELVEYFTENRVYLRYAWDKCTGQTFFRPQYIRLSEDELSQFRSRLSEVTKNDPSVFND